MADRFLRLSAQDRRDVLVSPLIDRGDPHTSLRRMCGWSGRSPPFANRPSAST
jgi:hypothetical protein